MDLSHRAFDRHPWVDPAVSETGEHDRPHRYDPYDMRLVRAQLQISHDVQMRRQHERALTCARLIAAVLGTAALAVALYDLTLLTGL